MNSRHHGRVKVSAWFGLGFYHEQKRKGTVSLGKEKISLKRRTVELRKAAHDSDIIVRLNLPR